MVTVLLGHQAGTPDLMNLKFASTTADCDFTAGFSESRVPSAAAGGFHGETVPVSRIFNYPN